MLSRIAQSTRSLFRSVSREAASEDDSAPRDDSIEPEAFTRGMVTTRIQSRSLEESNPSGTLVTNAVTLEQANEVRGAEVVGMTTVKEQVLGFGTQQDSLSELEVGGMGPIIPDSQSEVDTQRLVLRPHDAQEKVDDVPKASIPSDLEYIHGTQVIDDSQGLEGYRQSIENKDNSQHTEDKFDSTLQSDVRPIKTKEIQESKDSQATATKESKHESKERRSSTKGNTVSKVSTHKWFDDVEAIIPETQIESRSQYDGGESDNLAPLDLADDQAESADEAPDTLTAAAGQSQSRVATAEEVKAAQR